MNTAFAPDRPTLQIAWDATSIDLLKTCARKYQLSIIEGWVPRAESVDLTFGIRLHEGLELYHHLRSEDQSHDEALVTALQMILKATWVKDLRRPWSGDNIKNRLTLARTLVWYLDQFASDNLATVQLATGDPAVEMHFTCDLGFQIDGHGAVACGWLDRLVSLGGDIYVTDLKTTKHTLGPSYFAQFSPHGQFSMYSVAGKVALGLPIKGLIVDAAQVAVGFSRFARAIVPRSEGQLDEWLRDTRIAIGQAEDYALDDYWPMNDASCDKYGGCRYRDICSKPLGSRQQWLEANFTRRVWNPLEPRSREGIR